MQYDLKVLNARQELVLLTLDAADAEDAARQAEQLGHVVLSTRRAALAAMPRLRVSGRGFPIVLFSQELLSLLEAGLSLMESMQTLQEKEHRPAARRVLDGMMTALNEGLPLSQALERAEGVFPPLYVALVRASEKTSGLQDALARFVDYQTQVDAARKKVVSASIYPALLVLVGFLVVMFLMLYVVPKFSAIYEANTERLPWLSQLLLGWGRMLHGHAGEVLAGSVGLALVLGYALTRPGLRRWLVERIWAIPALGERWRVYQLARFYRTLGMLLRGGIPIVPALEMVGGLLQPNLRARLQTAIGDVREGQALSTVMENRGLTTPVAVRMLRVGERSGQMGEMMERIGHFYDDEIARWVDWFTRLFEPVLMTGIGLVVGLVVILMYMPIFELAGSIQ